MEGDIYLKYISDKKYIRLCFTLLKLNPNIQLFQLNEQDKQYITNISFLLDLFKPGIFSFEFELKEGNIKSNQVNNSLQFIHSDFQGIIRDIVNIQNSTKDSFDKFKEEIDVSYIKDIIQNIDNYEYINNISIALYLKNNCNATNYSDAKKYIQKNKIENVNLEILKGLWKEINSL